VNYGNNRLNIITYDVVALTWVLDLLALLIHWLLYQSWLFLRLGNFYTVVLNSFEIETASWLSLSVTVRVLSVAVWSVVILVLEAVVSARTGIA
jgi:hypothetical protein